MREPVPVVLAIDVEPDSAYPNRALEWQGFKRLSPYLRELRGRLADRTGERQRLTWFWRMDPQVEKIYKSADWAPRIYQDDVSETLRAGDEHGLHPHAVRWDPARKEWLNDYSNAAWFEHCVETSLESFQSFFGNPCESIRVGNGYFDNDVRAILERRALRFDLTIEPGEPPVGFLQSIPRPDYTSAETQPYRPSLEDFRKRDPNRAAGLWMIPLTSGVMPSQGLQWLRYLRSRWSSVGSIPVGYGTLRLWEPPQLVQPAIEKTLDVMERPCLVFAIRSEVLLNPWFHRNCRANLEWLVAQAPSRRFVFTTPRDLLQMMGKV